MRRAVAAVAIVIGAALIAATLALSLFQRTGEAERVLDRYQPVAAQGLSEFGGDYATTIDGAHELAEDAFPRLARDLGMTRAEFDSLVERDFAAVAAGIEAVPEIEAFIEPLLAQVEALPSSGFRPVFDLPIASLPTTAMPWLMLGAGLMLIVVGLAVALRPGLRSLAVAFAAGLAMAVGPVAISLPQRSSDAADVLPVLRAGLSEEFTADAENAVFFADSMVRQIRAELLPELARRLNLSSAELTEVLGRDYPAAARLLAEWDAIIARARVNAAGLRSSVDDFEYADGIDYEPLPWVIIAAGALLAAVAAAALYASRALPRATTA